MQSANPPAPVSEKLIWLGHILSKLLSNKDAGKSRRVMQAMLKMVKLDIKKLMQAAKAA